ncbi:Hypothetical protein LUCI_5110 [Lucifera butyrica]|uniref:histidine kinase n=1 Tax=Lucifera butyrica TaxID=1351585 RepID=A0A498RI95_9FIRM|nr:ATP-binding protein [Lucifera butyrica]VBB09812.1 Hypothetical protein LUCI_5110 [Lucifera butyrica]
MDYFQMSNLAILLGTILTAPMYAYLYAIYRERFLGIWTLCWIILFIRVLLFDYGLINWRESALDIFFYQAFYIVASFLLIYGTHNFTSRPVKKYWFYCVTIITALSILSTINKLPLVYKLIPSALLAAIALIYTGYIILNIETQLFGKYITGSSLILWGILTFAVTFFYEHIQVEIFTIIGFACGLLRLFTAGGILLVYFEKTRADLVSQEYLQQVNFELQQANQELNHFCHSVAHDFKAPLLSINQLAGFIVRDYYDQLDRNGQEIITHIQNKSAEVVTITDHLLELSRMSQKPLTMESIHLEPLFREVYDELIQLQPERNVVFRIKRLPVIYGDPIMIKILVTNILSNALKYTSKRKQVLIEVDSVENKNDYIISVRDNGAGFDMSESHRLFKIFERLHSVNEFEGTGVGLAVCQKILKRHYGKAWLTGKVDAGATFSFSFPKDMPKQNVNTAANLSYTI